MSGKKSKRARRKGEKRSRGMSADASKFVNEGIAMICEGQGCPTCGEETQLVTSQSTEFLDNSIVLMVVHNCMKCNVGHTTVMSTGGIASSEMPVFEAAMRAEGFADAERVRH